MLGFSRQFYYLASSILLSFNLSTLGLLAVPNSVYSQSSSPKLQYNPPKSSGQPRSSLAGATRGCPSEADFCVVPLLPGLIAEPDVISPQNQILDHYPITISERPIFFIYVPDFKGRMRFRLFEENLNGMSLNSQVSQIYESPILDINHKASILEFKLPDDAPYLEPNKNYKWRFTVSDVDQNLTVEGAVRKVIPSNDLLQQLRKAEPLEQATIYAKSGIWFEMVKALADLKCTQPDNAIAQSAWLDLFKLVKLGEITKQPLDCCQGSITFPKS